MDERKTRLNLNSWVFNALSIPEEINNIIPKIEVVPESLYQVNSLKELDIDYLDKHFRDENCFKRVGSLLQNSDISYVKLKPPNLIYTNIESNPKKSVLKSPFSQAVFNSCNHYYKHLIPNLEINTEQFDKDAFISEKLEPYKQLFEHIDKNPNFFPLSSHIPEKNTLPEASADSSPAKRKESANRTKNNVALNNSLPTINHDKRTTNLNNNLQTTLNTRKNNSTKDSNTVKEKPAESIVTIPKSNTIGPQVEPTSILNGENQSILNNRVPVFSIDDKSASLHGIETHTLKSQQNSSIYDQNKLRINNECSTTLKLLDTSAVNVKVLETTPNNGIQIKSAEVSCAPENKQTIDAVRLIDDNSVIENTNVPEVKEQVIRATEADIRKRNLEELEQFIESLCLYEAIEIPADQIKVVGDLVHRVNGDRLLSSTALQPLRLQLQNFDESYCLDTISLDTLLNLFKMLHNTIRNCESLVVLDPENAAHKHNSIQNNISKIETGLQAVQVVLILSRFLDQNLYLCNEDIIISIITLIRHHTSNTINAILSQLQPVNVPKNSAPSTHPLERHSSRIVGLLFSFSYIAQQLTELAQKVKLAATVNNSIVDLCINMLFMKFNQYSQVSNGLDTNIRRTFFSLLQQIFITNPDHRYPILEDVLTSLVKLPQDKQSFNFKLNGGGSIHGATSIILQLVQSCSVSNTAQVLKDQSFQELKILNFETEPEKFSIFVETLYEKGKACNEDCSIMLKLIIQFLILRVTKAKEVNEDAYRAIFDFMIEDNLKVFAFPEWPSSEIFLQNTVKLLCAIISDPKSEPNAKGLAIEYIGSIITRLKKPSQQDIINDYIKLCPQDSDSERYISSLCNFSGKFDIIVSTQELDSITKAHEDCATYLKALTSDDPNATSSYLMYMNEFGLWATHLYRNVYHSESSSVQLRLWIKTLILIWLRQLSNTENTKSSSDLDLNSKKMWQKISLVGEARAKFLSLNSLFNHLLLQILQSFDEPILANRSKAIRALSNLISVYPDAFRIPEVHEGLKQRLQDQSISVRGTALDVVSRFVTKQPESFSSLYPMICDRILDTGPAVRKRVIKLLTAVYPKLTDKKLKVEINCKLIGRTNDEPIKEAVVDALQSIWFFPIEGLDLDSTSDELRTSFSDLDLKVQLDITDRTVLIEEVVQKLASNVIAEHPAVYFLKKALTKPTDATTFTLRKWSSSLALAKLIVEAMFHHLLKLEDKTSINNVLRVIDVFTTASNQLILPVHISTLDGYLSPNTETIDQMIMYLALKIYNRALPEQTVHNKKFLAQIQDTLLSGLGRIANTVLMEAIPCLCLITCLLNTRQDKSYKLYQSCYVKLKAEEKSFNATGKIVAEKNTQRLLLIAGLLCSNIDKTTGKKVDDKFVKLNTKEALDEYFRLIVSFLRPDMSTAVKASALQSLGFLLTEYPQYLSQASCRQVFHDVFAQSVLSLKTSLLDVFISFLSKEKYFNKEEEKELDINYIGGKEENDEELYSALIQSCLPSILSSLLCKDTVIQGKSLKVVSMISEQGLVHPLECVPSLLALVCHGSDSLQIRANTIYDKLVTRHASFIHTKNTEAIRTIYGYAVSLNPEPKGYTVKPEGPLAHFHLLYASVQKTKLERNKLLKAMIDPFEIDLRAPNLEVDLPFLRYLVENLVMLEYKLADEILFVRLCIQTVLSITGAAILHHIESQSKVNPQMEYPEIIKATLAINYLLSLNYQLQIVYNVAKYCPNDRGDQQVTRHIHNMTKSWESLKFPSLNPPTPNLQSLVFEQFKFLNSQDTVVDSVPNQTRPKRAAAAKVSKKLVESDPESDLEFEEYINQD